MHKFDFIMNDDHGCVCVADPLQMVHVNCPDYVTFIFPRNWEQILRVAAAIAQCFIGFTFCQFPFCVLCVCVCVLVLVVVAFTVFAKWRRGRCAECRIGLISWSTWP